MQERADMIARFSTNIYWRNGRCTSTSIGSTVHIFLVRIYVGTDARAECSSWVYILYYMPTLW
jgi:hypothetical protein